MSAELTPAEMADAVTEGVYRSFPDATRLAYAVEYGTSRYVVLPPGSHLRIQREGRWIKGVDVVLLDTQAGSYGTDVRMLSTRGDWCYFTEDTRLVMGKS